MGGWVRNGIKITISKMRLYKFIRATYSREFNTKKHTISLIGHIVVYHCADSIRVFDDLRYGKVRYIGALRTAHYALRPP